MSEWTEKLKAGDEVIVSGFGSREYLAKVDRVTATQVVVGREKYRRDSGRKVGATGYFITYIVQPVPQIREKIERRDLTDKITRADFSHLPIEVLRHAHKLLCGPQP